MDDYKDPDKSSALVIIDLQNDFLSRAGNFPISPGIRFSLLADLKTLIPQFRQSGHIIWVSAIYENHTKEPAAMKAQTKGDGVVANNAWLTAATHVFPILCCQAGSWGAEIYPEVLQLAEVEDAFVTKGGYSAFNGTTALLDVLREKKVTDVYFCGVASGTCVLATVLDAVKLGDLQVHVVPDCLGWRRKDTHEEAMRRYKQLGVGLANSDEINIETSSSSESWTFVCTLTDLEIL